MCWQVLHSISASGQSAVVKARNATQMLKTSIRLLMVELLKAGMANFDRGLHTKHPTNFEAATTHDEGATAKLTCTDTSNAVPMCAEATTLHCTIISCRACFAPLPAA